MFIQRVVSIASVASVVLASAGIHAQGPGNVGETASGVAAVGEIVARVNGVPIPASRLELLVRRLVLAGQPDSPELRKQLRERLINQEVVAQAAANAGLEQNPEIRAQFELARQELLANAYLGAILSRNPPSEEVLRNVYDSIVATMGRKEYKVRHVLLASEDEARTVITDLAKGSSFEKLAEGSRDARTARNGGDLGWIGPEQVVKPFGEAMARLQNGQTTESPVQTQHGWHVIRVEDSRDRQIPSYEQARPRIVQQVHRQQIARIMQELVGKAKIE